MHCLLRCLSWRGVVRIIFKAVPVHPALAKSIAAFVHVVSLIASARAPDLIIFPAEASPGNESGHEHDALVYL